MPSIVYFDHGFKFPQTLRGALGLDHQLGWGTVLTVDLLYTRTLNQFYLNDVNIQGVQSKEAGEGGRLMYGVAGTPNGSRHCVRRRREADQRVVRRRDPAVELQR